jgi:hypothetical protein
VGAGASSEAAEGDVAGGLKETRSEGPRRSERAASAGSSGIVRTSKPTTRSTQRRCMRRHRCRNRRCCKHHCCLQRCSHRHRSRHTVAAGRAAAFVRARFCRGCCPGCSSPAHWQHCCQVGRHGNHYAPRPGRPVRLGLRCPLRRRACCCAARRGCDCGVRLGRGSNWCDRVAAYVALVRCRQASRLCLRQLATARSANAETCRERCRQAARSRHLSVLQQHALAGTTKAAALQRAVRALVELNCNVNSSDWQQRQAAPRRNVPTQHPQAGEVGTLQSWGASLATPVRSRDTCRSRTSVRGALRCVAGALHRSMPSLLGTGVQQGLASSSAQRRAARHSVRASDTCQTYPSVGGARRAAACALTAHGVTHPDA